MNIIIAGSTGMIGNLVLNQCLNADKISKVISLVRKPTGLKHEKLIEVVIQNFEDYDEHANLFKDIQCAYFCVGAYTGQFPDEMFKKITINYAVAFAAALKRESNDATICLLSGMGADRTGKSNTSFAKYKGMAENEISALNLKFYTFRPAYIYPVTARKEPNIGYQISRFIYPLLKIFGKSLSVKSTELANAIFNVGINGADKEILENKDIFKYIN
jgi:uncharacterized protein YbjT (DUF2867 family)